LYADTAARYCVQPAFLQRRSPRRSRAQRTLFQDGADMALEQLRLHGRDQRLARGGVQVVLTPLVLLR